MNRLLICHRCPRRQKPCAGACLCAANGRDIALNAAQGTCPEGRFGLGPGDLLAGLFKVTGIAWAAGRWARWRGRPCGCDERRRRINGWWGRIKALRRHEIRKRTNPSAGKR